MKMLIAWICRAAVSGCIAFSFVACQARAEDFTGISTKVLKRRWRVMDLECPGPPGHFKGDEEACAGKRALVVEFAKNKWCFGHVTGTDDPDVWQSCTGLAQANAAQNVAVTVSDLADPHKVMDLWRAVDQRCTPTIPTNPGHSTKACALADKYVSILKSMSERFGLFDDVATLRSGEKDCGYRSAK